MADPARVRVGIDTDTHSIELCSTVDLPLPHSIPLAFTSAFGDGCMCDQRDTLVQASAQVSNRLPATTNRHHERPPVPCASRQPPTTAVGSIKLWLHIRSASSRLPSVSTIPDQVCLNRCGIRSLVLSVTFAGLASLMAIARSFDTLDWLIAFRSP